MGIKDIHEPDVRVPRNVIHWGIRKREYRFEISDGMVVSAPFKVAFINIKDEKKELLRTHLQF